MESPPNSDKLLFRISLILLAVLVLGGIVFYAVLKKDKQKDTPPIVEVEKPLILTEEQKIEVAESMTASPEAEPALTVKEEKAVIESMTAPPDSKPALTNKQREELLEAMTP